MSSTAKISPQRSKPRFQLKRDSARFFFPAPSLLFLAVMLAFPVAYIIWLSLHDWYLMDRAAPVFVGLHNYIDLFSDQRFLHAVVKTLWFSFLAVLVQIPLGVLCALIFSREFRGRGIIRTIFILPLASTPVAISLVWILMMNPNLGVLNYLLSLIHLQPDLWLASQKTVIRSLIMVDTWMWTPLVMLIVLGGLSNLPSAPYESAQIDGANGLQKFWYITLPLVRPAIMAALILRTIDVLKTFDIIFIMSEGGPAQASETMNVYLFLQSFQFFHMGEASAIAVCLLALVLCVSLILSIFRRGRD